MEIKTINIRQLTKSTHHSKTINSLNELITEINTKEVSKNISDKINEIIKQINDETDEKAFLIKLQEGKNNIIKIVIDELKWIPKNYYRKTMLPIGMVSIGLPIGVCFGLLLDNMGLMGIGLPIGIAIGTLLGSIKDKKALEENRQLETEI